eukprot:m.118620 g.118620  ORF g.118620 m.118620 type:complete len:338 (-) comp15453_c3_seq1:287-1300(-)
MPLSIWAMCFACKGDTNVPETPTSAAWAFFETQLAHDQRTASALHNLGIVYADLNNNKKAANYYWQALQIRVQLVGENHPDTAAIYKSLAILHREERDFERALAYCHKALDIRLTTLGEQHPDTAGTYASLGHIYADQGDTQQALSLYQRSLEINRTVLGERHANTALAYNNIGTIFSQQKEYQQAIAYYEKAAEIYASFCQIDPEVANTYHNLGNAHGALGQVDQAKKYYTQALHIRQATVGEHHPLTQTTKHLLEGLLNDAPQEPERPAQSSASDKSKHQSLGHHETLCPDSNRDSPQQHHYNNIKDRGNLRASEHKSRNLTTPQPSGDSPRQPC